MTKICIQDIAVVPDALRNAYLDSLSEAQELHLETLVKRGRPFLIKHENDVIGYSVVHDSSVVEFFVVSTKVNLIAEAFKEVLRVTKSTWARCKTFDSQMLEAAASLPATKQTGGILFRNFVSSGPAQNPSIAATIGKPEELNEILAIHDGFFDSREEILDYLRVGGLFVFRMGEELVGCGICMRIIEGRSGFDVGMVVSPTHRRKGLGSYIAARLKDHCLGQGYDPVCGCHVDNVASRRALETAGFVSLHSIVEFRY